jgi:hypothetical protein
VAVVQYDRRWLYQGFCIGTGACRVLVYEGVWLAHPISELQQGQSFAHRSKLFTAKDIITELNMDPARTRWLSSS